MEVAESLLIELCNAREDVGALRERLVWLQAKLDVMNQSDRDRPFIQARFNLAEAQLESAQTDLRKIYKEMYG